MISQTHSRAALAIVVIALLSACAAPAAAPATPPTGGAPQVTLVKSPTCGCCGEHEAYLRKGGMSVQAVVDENITDIKETNRIPTAMWSCHTSMIDGYFVEGHVPLAAIQQLMAERPAIDGISLPGMPAGSPGMGGTLEGPLVVYAILDGQVVGEFGSY